VTNVEPCCGRWSFCLLHVFLFFSPPKLVGHLTDCHQILPRVWRWTRFIKLSHRF